MTGIIERTELLQPEPAQALGSLLGVPVPDLARGEGLPLTWHWLYLLERPAQADLGPDGHPLRGTIPAPPGAGRRRMWAGGQVRSLAPLRCGEHATRRTRVLSSVEKTGRTGRLTFVTVGHEIEQDGQVRVEERQDVVYRDAVDDPRSLGPDSTSGSAVAEPGATRPAASDEWQVVISPTLLFRYSALTYNAHRIHYDRDYARDVEGYPGLVTHGPLQALAMAEAARAHGVAPAPVLRFDYRLVSPLFDHQGLVARATLDEGLFNTSVRDITGRQTARGTLTAMA